MSEGTSGIGLAAFEYCTSLVSVVIPASVISVEDGAFFGCGILTAVYFSGSAPSPGSNVFFDANKATVYYLPGTTGWGPTLGPGHLDPARAARAVALLAPRVAIPIHWGTFALPGPFGGRAVGDAPAREFAEFAARDAPDVEVRLLRPGERTTLA